VYTIQTSRCSGYALGFINNMTGHSSVDVSVPCWNKKAAAMFGKQVMFGQK